MKYRFIFDGGQAEIVREKILPLSEGIIKRMVYEHRIKKQLEDFKTENGIIKDVRVLSLFPMKVSLRVVSERPLNAYEIDQIKEVVEDKLHQATEIEMVIAISR